jgi:quinol monooxygenase YgiN
MAKGIAQVKVKQEGVKDFIHAVTELAIPTRAEKGCIFYELYQMKDEPCDFFFVEEWDSEDDLQKHLQSPHVKAFVEKAAGLTDGQVRPFFWKKVV